MSEMKGTATIFVRSPKSLADSDVVPARDVAIASEPYVVVDGFPKVPSLWASGKSVLSANGTYVSRRDDPVEIELEAHTRFLANGYDNLSGVWKPFVTSGIDYLWMSAPGLEPISEMREYRLHKELLRRYALRFNAGDYLYSSFNQGMDDAISFSVVLVMTPLVPSGYTIFATKDTETPLEVAVDNGFVLRYGEESVRIRFDNRMNLNHTPTYVVLSHDGATVTLSVGTSARNLTSVSLRAPGSQVQHMDFYLGKTHKGKATATMELFEMDLINGPLNRVEAYGVVHNLATAYGST